MVTKCSLMRMGLRGSIGGKQGCNFKQMEGNNGLLFIYCYVLIKGPKFTRKHMGWHDFEAKGIKVSSFTS